MAVHVPAQRRSSPAMQEVGPSIFFSLLVITVSFLPVFTLEATEGRLFKPLAFTKTYSIGFAAILAVTLTPALAVLLIRGKVHDESRNPLNRWLAAAYAPVVRFVVRPSLEGARRGAASRCCSPSPRSLASSSEFMPPLNEGVDPLHADSAAGHVRERGVRAPAGDGPRAKEVPRGRQRVRQGGTRRNRDRSCAARHGGDHRGAEAALSVAPRDSPGTRSSEEMDAKLHFPGMPNVWWMPIQTRTEMLATGVRSPLGIEVFGDDLGAIEKTAIAVEHAVSRMPGDAQRVRGAVDGRLLRRLRREPCGSGPPRADRC